MSECNISGKVEFCKVECLFRGYQKIFFVGSKMFQVLDFMIAFSVASLPTSFLKLKEKLKYFARQVMRQVFVANTVILLY